MSLRNTKTNRSFNLVANLVNLVAGGFRSHLFDQRGFVFDGQEHGWSGMRPINCPDQSMQRLTAIKSRRLNPQSTRLAKRCG